MPAKVTEIKPGSIAEETGLIPGDEIISIDGTKPEDLADYKFLISSENIELHIKKSSGEEEIIEIEKDTGDDLGIIFESAVFDKIIPCNNKCIFCFVDQQPCGLRKSLYVKDDDYRLSYLQGTYVTLTNLNKKMRARIEKLRPGPLYVSVHTTNPELRIKMLRNPKAGKIMEELKRLNELEIPVHTQIVLCPEINDGKKLKKTLEDLATLKSNIMSIAIVPVGITRFRKETDLIPITSEKAREVILQSEEFNEKIKMNLALPSDEFYILAGIGLPKRDFYGNFGQLDDGVGPARFLQNDFDSRKKNLPDKLRKPFSFAIATGEIAVKVLQPVINELNKIENLDVKLIPVKSDFWGKNITVAGLITGKDLIENLLPLKNEITDLLIPSVMLRKYTDSFLDDINKREIENILEIKIHVIENYYDTKELTDFIADKA